MSFLSFCQWIQNTAFSTAIRDSIWLFPIIETTHVLALSLSVGTIAIVDLRLAGVAMRTMSVSQVLKQLLPLALGGFAVMFLTGVFLFTSQPLKCYHSIFFRIKMLLLILAGLNALIYQLTLYRSMAEWDTKAPPPLRVRLVGFVSLALWIAIVAAGRTMAYKF